MNDDSPLPPAHIQPKKWSPYCSQTVSGACLYDNLQQWGDLGVSEAKIVRNDIGSSDDATSIIEAGRDAKRISDDVDRLYDASDEVELCAHCPRRREIEG